MDNETKIEDKEVKAKVSKPETKPVGLTDEEKAKIKAQVDKELEIEAKKKLEKEYKDSLLAEAKKKELFKDAKSDDGTVQVYIDMPPTGECIRLDGVAYYPDRTYKVTPEVAAVLYDQMYKGHQHEDEVTGRRDSNAMRRKRNTILKQ